jgi:hypothetical protein
MHDKVICSPLHCRLFPQFGWGDFDNRYLPYLWRANLLPIANIACRVMLIFDAMTITVMVDR